MDLPTWTSTVDEDNASFLLTQQPYHADSMVDDVLVVDEGIDTVETAATSAQEAAALFFRNMEDFNRVFVPIVCFLGLAGNGLSILVFMSTGLRRVSASHYLTALAFADCGNIIAILLVRFVQRCFKTLAYCQIVTYASYVFGALSVWYVVAFTFERFIVVYFPLQRLALCTVRRARIVIVSLCGTSLTLNAYILVMATSGPYHNNSDSTNNTDDAQRKWSNYTNATNLNASTSGIGQSGNAGQDQQPMEFECTLVDEYKEYYPFISAADTLITAVVPILFITALNTAITYRLVSTSNRVQLLMQPGKVKLHPPGGGRHVLKHVWMRQLPGIRNHFNNNNNNLSNQFSESGFATPDFCSSPVLTRRPFLFQADEAQQKPVPTGFQVAEPVRKQFLYSTVSLHSLDNGSISNNNNCSNSAGTTVRLSKDMEKSVLLQRRQQMGSRREHRLTRTLLIVSIVFVTLNLPTHLLRLVWVLDEVDLITLPQHTKLTVALLRHVVDVLYYLGFCINFFLYSFVGMNFRKYLKQLLAAALCSGFSSGPFRALTQGKFSQVTTTTTIRSLRSMDSIDVSSSRKQ